MHTRSFQTEILIVGGLWLFGLLGGLWIDTPNVHPLAAISLFSGVVFRRWWLACLCPISLCLMQTCGGESAGILVGLGVCLGLGAGIPLGRYLRGGLLRLAGKRQWVGASCRVLVGSIVGSFIFYLVSNTAWWLAMGIYPRTALGWGECLIAGLPFLANTLLGDMMFSTVVFTAAALAVFQPMRSAIWTAFKAAPLRS